MLKLLLVDDEYIVLKGLEIVLRDQKEVSLEIRTAIDAVDAYEKAEGWTPDVIIADINMPEIDGLTMLERLSVTIPLCRFIIVSGYEENEYLKRAPRLHVDDYLLKPVDKLYLIRRLKQIDEEKKARIKNTLMKCRLMLFRGHFFHDSEFSGQETEEFLYLPYFSLFVAGLSPSGAREAKSRLAGYFEQIFVFSQNNWSIFLLNYSVKLQTEDIRAILAHVLDGSISGIADTKQNGEKQAFLEQIAFHYQNALCDMLLSILPVSEAAKARAAEKIAAHTLASAVRVITFELSAAAYVNEIYAAAEAPEDNFLMVFTETLSAYIMIADINLPAASIQKLYQTHVKAVVNERTLAAFLEKSQNLGNDLLTPAEQEAYSSKVDAARAYIAEHYQEDIALEQVAEFVSVNPSYLSYIFKKETGITFLQYLTNVRMQKACQLMTADPGLSLEEIAIRCGYHSASYFHKIFRGKFGVSPRQWLQNSGNSPLLLD